MLRSLSMQSIVDLRKGSAVIDSDVASVGRNRPHSLLCEELLGARRVQICLRSGANVAFSAKILAPGQLGGQPSGEAERHSGRKLLPAFGVGDITLIQRLTSDV